MFKYKVEEIYFLCYVKIMMNVRDNVEDIMFLFIICRERNIIYLILFFSWEYKIFFFGIKYF